MDDRSWVLDASVLLKWFLPAADEPDSELARNAIGNLPIRTTSLAYFEVGNALTRSPSFSPADIAASLELVAEICGPPIELGQGDFTSTATVASDFGLTFYDASYVALARRLNREVISADSDLLDPKLAVDIQTALA